MRDDLWKITKFKCMNHERPISLYDYTDSRGSFYACRKYMKMDDEHPMGYTGNEPKCFNRLSYTTAMDIVTKFQNIMEKDGDDAMGTDYTGFKFSVKGVDVKVLTYRNDKLRFGVLNKSILRTGF